MVIIKFPVSATMVMYINFTLFHKGFLEKQTKTQSMII